MRLIAALAGQAEEITISFTADPDSPFGGWHYYGSHLTDLCAAIAGCGMENARAVRRGREVEAVVTYPGLTVRLLSSPEQKELKFSARLKDGTVHNWALTDYEHCYRLGVERFAQMLRDGVSVCPERLVFGAELLDRIVRDIT